MGRPFIQPWVDKFSYIFRWVYSTKFNGFIHLIIIIIFGQITVYFRKINDYLISSFFEKLNYQTKDKIDRNLEYISVI